MNAYERIAGEVGRLVTEKDAAYGSAFVTAGESLRLLYPQGIPPEKLGDALLLARIWDKMMRIATRKDYAGESPYRDISGYGVLGAARDQGEAEQARGDRHLRDDVARIWGLIPEDVRSHARDVEHAVELLATSELAASQAAFQCCARSAWGDGEHDQGCPKAALEAELVQLRSDLDLARADLASHVEALDRRCARLREERDTANEVVARVTRALNGREEELAAARANASKAMAERDAALLQLGEAGKFNPRHQEG